jgi:hypothetical protein
MLERVRVKLPGGEYTGGAVREIGLRDEGGGLGKSDVAGMRGASGRLAGKHVELWQYQVRCVSAPRPQSGWVPSLSAATQASESSLP